MLEPSYIPIRVFVPPEKLSLVMVMSNATIGSLNHLFNDASYSYIYEGHEISNDSQILDENIKKDSFLIALCPEQKENKNLMARWLSFSEKTPIYTEQKKILFNPKNQNEICRLRDLHIMRSEWKLRNRSFIKVTSLPPEFISSNQKDIPLELDFKKGTAPSTDPLPPFWDG